MKATKVFIIAYTRRNLGDDLFIRKVLERYTHTKFRIFAPDIYKKIYKDYANFKCVPSDHVFFRMINALFKRLRFSDNVCEFILAKRSDIILNIGGSLFIEGNEGHLHKSFRDTLGKYKKPIYLIGCNFGPYKTEEFYLYMKNVFSTYQQITFRDQYSYQLFKDMPNTKYADDLLFSLYNPRIQTSEKSVAISVLDLSWREYLKVHTDKYEAWILEITRFYLEKKYKVILISFCEEEGDLKAIQRILRKIDSRDKSLEIVNYTGNINDVLEVFKKSEIIYATRFHAMVFGLAYNKKVIPIIYSNKIKNVLEDNHYQGFTIEIDKTSKLDLELIDALPQVIFDIEGAAKTAKNHFIELDQLLS